MIKLKAIFFKGLCRKANNLEIQDLHWKNSIGCLQVNWLTGVQKTTTYKTKTYDLENDDLETNDLENDDLENNDLENDDLENNDLENYDLENNDLENDDLENDDLENNDLENDDLKENRGWRGLNRSERNAPSPDKTKIAYSQQISV